MATDLYHSLYYCWKLQQKTLDTAQQQKIPFCAINRSIPYDICCTHPLDHHAQCHPVNNTTLLLCTQWSKNTRRHARTHARTHTHTQPFYGSMDFVWNNPESRYQKKHSPTHTYCGQLVINHPLSASSIYYDPWHPPCSIHAPDNLFPQSLSKFSLVYLLAWHPPLHTPYICSLNPILLFATHAHTIATYFAVVLRLCQLILVSLSQLFTWDSITHPSYHSHLCPLKCHLIFLSYTPGLTSMQHTTSHTTAVQSPSHFQWYNLIGKQWYQLPDLFHPIQILFSTAASASPSTLNMSPK